MMDVNVSRFALVAALTAIALLVGVENDARAQESVVDPSDSGAWSSGHAPDRAQAEGQGGRTATRESRRKARTSRKSRTSRTSRKGRKSRTARTRRPREVTATVDVGVGPSFFAFGNPFQDGKALSGPIYEDQPVHYGLRFDAAAIIDYEFYKQNRRLVPRQYRGMFKPDTEIRYAPAAVALIPRNLYLSPKTDNTGVYGATWELMRLGLTLLKSSSTTLSAGAGLLATYVYIDSDAFESTHFLRPGLSLGLNLGTMFNDSFGASVGWDSNFYLPQDIGGGILDGGGDDALWHIGEGFLMFHYRFPYTTRI